ncbi:hypothetical protein KLER11_gp50 [Pararheinheimera phage vB_PsoM_KLER1-1]|nr:hypothetical protein KLER11_gp50 [Pararheinheimera phage vB_PsoM_KLER1-1]
MKYVNLTPHAVRVTFQCIDHHFDPLLHPHNVTWEPSGVVARVSSEHKRSGSFAEVPHFTVEYGDVSGLPEPEEGTVYIVSMLVLQATDRDDVVAPASGHPDVVRKDGQIWSVPGFVRK